MQAKLEIQGAEQAEKGGDLTTPGTILDGGNGLAEYSRTPCQIGLCPAELLAALANGLAELLGVQDAWIHGVYPEGYIGKNTRQGKKCQYTPGGVIWPRLAGVLHQADLHRLAEADGKPNPLRMETIMGIMQPPQFQTTTPEPRRDFGFALLPGLACLGLASLVLAAFPRPQVEKTQSETPLYAVVAQGKWGFIDTRGEIVIDATYERVGDFHEGLAAVRVDGRYGFINPEG